MLISSLLLFLWGWDAFCWLLIILGAGRQARLEMNGLLRICFPNLSSHKSCHGLSLSLTSLQPTAKTGTAFQAAARRGKSGWHIKERTGV